MSNFAKYISSLLNEATQEEIDKLKEAMDKVSNRPFNELFQDKGDRFLIKVYNPTFEKSAKALNLDIEKFDWKKREYDGKNINRLLKELRLKDTMMAFIIRKNVALRDREPERWFTDEEIKNDYAQLRKFNGTFREWEREYSQSYISPIPAFKQTIDQNNIFYYLLFSRHPIDVLRMSDHKGISSCHRLKGAYSKDQGMYSHCAIADAKNDGGIIYLIKGGDARRIKSALNEKEIFEDKDRNISGIRPLGRIRLRRFIDLKTGKDFAVPTTLQDEQKYGTFTTELYEIAETYTRKHQAISQNPPTPEYARENIVLVGGTYSDEALEDLLGNFFKKYNYKNITHKSGNTTTWDDEMLDIVTAYSNRLDRVNASFHYEIEEHAVATTVSWDGDISWDDLDVEYVKINTGEFAHRLKEYSSLPKNIIINQNPQVQYLPMGDFRLVFGDINEHCINFSFILNNNIPDPDEVNNSLLNQLFLYKIFEKSNTAAYSYIHDVLKKYRDRIVEED